MEPGEIDFADHHTTAPHPVVIVSREELNRGSYVVAILLTSRHFQVRSKLPNCVPFHAGEFGLWKDCVAQAETISPIELTDIDLASGLIGRLDEPRLRDLIKAIGYVIGSDCEPVA